jgi:thymidylate kinase
VFLLDMSPTAADGRLRRTLDRMERQGSDYRERLRAGFLAEAARAVNCIHVIDANRPVETVQAEIRGIGAGLLADRLSG